MKSLISLTVAALFVLPPMILPARADPLPPGPAVMVIIGTASTTSSPNTTASLIITSINFSTADKCNAAVNVFNDIYGKVPDFKQGTKVAEFCVSQ
jgi:hypothetical protein